MNTKVKKDILFFRIFRWVAPGILLAGAFMPAFFMSYAYIVDRGRQTYYDWSQIRISLFLIIIPLLSLFFPFIGGILGLLVTPVVIIGFELVYSFLGGLSNYGKTFLTTITSLLVIGSLLSIFFGILRWWWRRRQSKETEKPSHGGIGIKDGS
jgi:hypothetical protein